MTSLQSIEYGPRQTESRKQHVLRHVQGPATSLVQSFNFTTVSSSQASITLSVPSSDYLIDKRFYVELDYRYDFTDAAGPAVRTGAPRDYPVNRLIQNCEVRINGTSLSSQPSDLLSAMTHYQGGFDEFRSRFHSTTPTQADKYNSLAGLAVTTIDGPFITDSGSCNINESTRASFPFIAETTAAGPPAVRNRQYTFREPLIHGLLDSDDGTDILTNVRDISVNITFDSSNALAKSWGNFGANHPLSVTITGARLILRYTQMSIDPVNVFATEFTDYVVRSQPGTADVDATGVLTNQVFSNIIYGQVPRKLFIFAKPRTPHIQDGTAFLRIDRIQLQLGNRGGLLSSLTSRDLYQMSVNNGYQKNFVSWTSRLGSVLCIDVAEDLGGSLVPGSLGNVAMSFTADFTCLQTSPTGAARPYDIFCVALMDGVLKIPAGGVPMLNMGISQTDAMTAPVDDENNDEELVLKEDVSGSGYNGLNGGSFKSFLRGVKKFAPVATQIASTIAGMTGNPLAMKITDAADRAAQNLAASGMMASGYRTKGRGLLRN